MPEYQIQAPDGNSYKIQGPPGATQADIVSRVTAKFPQAAKPKDAQGPSALGIAGAVGKDIAGGLLNPKELGREAYHTVTDWAGHTLAAASDVADWIGDKTGLRKLVGEDIWTGHHQNLSDLITGKGNDYNLTKLISSALTSEKFIREPQTVTGRAIKDIGEFTLSMATAGKVFGVANKTLQGGIAAWTVFDPQGGRLSDLVQKYPSLRNPITNFLKSDPGDSAMESRLKNALEGIGAGKMMDGFVKGLNLLRSAMRGQTAAKAFELAREDKPRARIDPTTGKLVPAPTTQMSDAPKGWDSVPGGTVQRKMTKAEAEKSLKPLLDKIGREKVSIHDSPNSDTFPDAARQSMNRDAVKQGITDLSRVRGVHQSGDVHIFANAHQDEEALRQTLIHEVVGHRGIRGVLGEEWNSTMQDIFNNSKNKEWFKDYAKRHQLDLTKEGHQRHVADEYIAHLAQTTSENPGVWRQVVDAVRSGLRKLGVTKEWTEDDIRSLVRQSYRGLEGRASRAASEGSQFVLNPEQTRKMTQKQFTSAAMAELHGKAEAQAQMAGEAAAGKAPNLAEGVAKSAEEIEAETKGPKPATPSQTLEQAFSPAPLAAQAKGQLSEWWRWTKELVAPGSVSPAARQAEADIAGAYASHMQHVEERFRRSPERREFWDTNPKKVATFIREVEGGKPIKDPDLERARVFYKAWTDRVAQADRAKGIEYTPEDHYVPHLFEDQKGVQEWIREQGTKAPGFAKERTFALYEQAVKAGFKPRFLNPEDMFQARQHASDLAHARIDALRNMIDSGLASEERHQGLNTRYSTPDGKSYWVHDDARLLLNRMFDERSLWSDRSPLGSAYRGMVALKNNIIPVRLAFSAFHPLHVLTMHVLAASATRSYKAGEWVSSHYREGSRALKMLRGEIPSAQLTAEDRQSLQYLGEGGLILEQDPRYRTQALEKLRTAFVNGNPGALLHVHTGALQVLQNAIFKTWIPSLKGASYLADVRAALKAQPSLIDDASARRVALRRIAKSVENRYGEMNYSTLFWNRMFRDVSVLSATSMGWQLGLFREYGGGAGQLANALGKIAMRPGNARQIYQALKKSGDLDKLIYVANYSTIAASLGGFITWAMTHKLPTETMDFFAPKNGETNADGTPARVRTMFYPYEFAAMSKRVEHEGPTRAAAEFIAAKGTGIPSMLAETWTGIDSLGRDIRDPKAPVMDQVHQTLDAILRENMPISLQQRGATPETARQQALNVAGLSRAPKYLQETSGEAHIEDLWRRYYKAAETPFQAGVKSAERQKLQAAIHSKDDKTVDKLLPDMVQKFNLRAQDAKRIVRDASLGMTQYQALFKEMREDDQKDVLKKMPPEERQKYLPYAKRKVMAEFSE